MGSFDAQLEKGHAHGRVLEPKRSNSGACMFFAEKRYKNIAIDLN